MFDFVPMLILIIFWVVQCWLFFQFLPTFQWILVAFAGLYLPFINIVRMRFLGKNPRVFLRVLLKAKKAGLKDIPIQKLEVHFLAGGNIDRVVDWLIAAFLTETPLTFEQAVALDRA